MPSIQELREKLQEPRKEVDTFYGKYCMRPISIYLTSAFSKTPLTPSAITLLSVLSGVLGAWLLARGDWIWGLFFVNGWYLLDHVDGELARLRGASSLSGLYFDTIANAIVPPVSLMGLAASLTYYNGDPTWLVFGFAAAYGSLLLLIVPYCESAVILQWLRDKDSSVRFAPIRRAPQTISRPFFKRIFSMLHLSVTFPVFLPVWTLLTVVFEILIPSATLRMLEATLIFYAVAAPLVAFSSLANKVLTRKVDAHYASLKQ